MCKATDGCDLPNLVVVDAVRNVDGRGMVNIAVPRGKEAAEYKRWHLWNSRLVATVVANGRGGFEYALVREKEAAAYPKWSLWNAREKEEVKR